MFLFFIFFFSFLILVSMKSVLFWFVVIVATRASPPGSDACEYIDPSSHCEDSGLCSGTAISCLDMYITAAKTLIIPRYEAPMTPIIDPFQTTSIQLLQSGPPTVPGTWSTRQEFVNLVDLLDQMSAKFQSQYPMIEVDILLLRQVVNAAKIVGTTIATPLIQGPGCRAFVAYQKFITQTNAVKSIDTYLDIVLEYITSCEFNDQLRGAIVAHLGPYFHAWLTVFRHLKLPSPLSEKRIPDIIMHMVKFDPLYPETVEEKIWVVPVNVEDLNYRSGFPIVRSDDEEPIPDNVYESIDLTINKPATPETVLGIIEIKLPLMLTSPIPRAAWGQISVFIRASFFYIQNHPGLPTRDFCQSTRDLWRNMFTSIFSWNDCFARPFLIPLFQICGFDYLSLEDRVSFALPVMVGRRISPGTLHPHYTGQSPLSVYDIRRVVEFRYANLTDSQGHHMFLSRFVADATGELATGHASDTSYLRTLGQMIALLVIEGDPLGTLQSILSHSVRPSFYLGCAQSEVDFVRP